MRIQIAALLISAIASPVFAAEKDIVDTAVAAGSFKTLVAAVQGMYPLSLYPTDHFYWEFLAFATGTGGNILIIGSSAGVAAMGMERITFTWFLKRISLLALIGYLAGAMVYRLESLYF